MRALGASLVHRVLFSDTGRSTARHVYDAVAASAARRLSRLDGVDSVYASSGESRHGFEPGFSKVGLLVVTHPLRVGDELALRHALDAETGRIRRVAPMVSSIVYVPHSELDYLRYFGSGWTLGLDSELRHVAGTARLGEAVGRAPIERRLLELQDCLRRWFQVSPVLLSVRDARVPFGSWRSARSLLAECLVRYYDVDGEGSFEDLLYTAQGALGLPSCPGGVREFSEAASVSLTRLRWALLATLLVLERFAAEVTEAWIEAPGAALGAYEPRLTDGIRRGVAIALAAGFSSVCCAARDAGGREQTLLLVSSPRATAAEALSRGAAVLQRLSERGSYGAVRPVVVTAPLLRAAYLFDPPPFVFDSLAHPAATLGGPVVWARLCPPPALEHAVVTAHQVQLFWRPRRAGKVEQRISQLEREVRFLAPELRLRESAGAVTFQSGANGAPEPEATLLARFHDELDALRPTLEGSVDARRTWRR